MGVLLLAVEGDFLLKNISPSLDNLSTTLQAGHHDQYGLAMKASCLLINPKLQVRMLIMDVKCH